MVTVLVAEKAFPRLRVTPISLFPQSNNSPVEVEKKVETEKVKLPPIPKTGVSTANEMISQYSCA